MARRAAGGKPLPVTDQDDPAAAPALPTPMGTDKTEHLAGALLSDPAIRAALRQGRLRLGIAADTLAGTAIVTFATRSIVAVSDATKIAIAKIAHGEAGAPAPPYRHSASLSLAGGCLPASVAAATWPRRRAEALEAIALAEAHLRSIGRERVANALARQGAATWAEPD